MRRWVIIAALVLAGCPAAPAARNPAGPAVCEAGPASPAAAIEREAAITGELVSVMRRDGAEIFVVESGDNTVSRFDTETGSYDVLVDVGNERGPWDVWVTDDELWITNYIANTVSVADRRTGEVIDEITHDSFEGPSGIAMLDGRVYVGNAQYRGDNDYGPGSVTVINAETHEVYGTVATKRQNPQSIDVVDRKLVVVDSGTFSNDGTFVAGSEAAIEVWIPTPDALLPEQNVTRLPLVDDPAIGVPGRPAHRKGSSVIYLPSATAPVVFAFDVETRTWLRGSDNPIRLYETNRNALHHASLSDDGILAVTAFNEDAMYLVDTSCDAVLDEIALESSSMLAGAHAVLSIGDEVFFVLERANEIGRVRLDFGDTDD